jgi:hypothetical protein
MQNLSFPGLHYKEVQKLLTEHAEAFLYVEMMFKKTLEEKAV